MMLRRITKLPAARSSIFTSYCNPINHRLLHGTLSGINSNNSIDTRTLSFSHDWTTSIARTMLFSAAVAATFVEEAHAKEPIPPEFRPKEVIVYQHGLTYSNPWIIVTFLDYYDIPYKIVDHYFSEFDQRITSSCHDKKPRIMVDGELIVDSPDKRDIIGNLAEKINLDFAARSVTEHNEERKWRGWAETHLIHMVLLNIYRSKIEFSKSIAYSYYCGNLSFPKNLDLMLYGVGTAYSSVKALKKLHNITDEYAALYKAVEKWVNALNGRNFLGGTKPNLADLAVFGVLRQLYDESRQEMIENTRIGDWYSRMEYVVGMSSKIQA